MRRLRDVSLRPRQFQPRLLPQERASPWPCWAQTPVSLGPKPSVPCEAWPRTRAGPVSWPAPCLRDAAGATVARCPAPSKARWLPSLAHPPTGLGSLMAFHRQDDRQEMSCSLLRWHCSPLGISTRRTPPPKKAKASQAPDLHGSPLQVQDLAPLLAAPRSPTQAPSGPHRTSSGTRCPSPGCSPRSPLSALTRLAPLSFFPFLTHTPSFLETSSLSSGRHCPPPSSRRGGCCPAAPPHLQAPSVAARSWAPFLLCLFSPAGHTQLRGFEQSLL